MQNPTDHLQTAVRITIVFLILATWAIVWQAQIIQQQKHMIRQLSGFKFQD